MQLDSALLIEFYHYDNLDIAENAFSPDMSETSSGWIRAILSGGKNGLVNDEHEEG